MKTWPSNSVQPCQKSIKISKAVVRWGWCNTQARNVKLIHTNILYFIIYCNDLKTLQQNRLRGSY